MKKILFTEEQIRYILGCDVSSILKESASSLLYHFLDFYNFQCLVKTNSFTPTDFESNWHGGKKTLSFSRTKSFREGWPIIMYSGYDGKGDDWCAIRLTIDGNLFNTHPNFKVNGKQHHLSVKPFDWAYKYMDNGDPYTFADNYDGIFAQNGKEWMMQSDEYIATYLPINYGNKRQPEYVNGVGDKQGHPYSQAEDRLTTTSDVIPNAYNYILKVDILLMPYSFGEDNLDDRKELYNIVTKSIFKNKIHVYDNMRNLELESNEVKNLKILLRKTSNNYKNRIPAMYDLKKQDF